MNKKILLPVAALALIGVATFGVSQAFAQTTADAHQTLVERIATKFNLSKTDVQSVFDDAHKERQATMTAKYQEMLTTAVSEGKITTAQKDALLAKHTELVSKRMTARANMQNLSREELRTQMEKERTDLEEWARQQGVDVKYLFGGLGRMGGRMHMKMGI